MRELARVAAEPRQNCYVIRTDKSALLWMYCREIAAAGLYEIDRREKSTSATAERNFADKSTFLMINSQRSRLRRKYSFRRSMVKFKLSDINASRG
jgi:hypothetical protein